MRKKPLDRFKTVWFLSFSPQPVESVRADSFFSKIEIQENQAQTNLAKKIFFLQTILDMLEQVTRMLSFDSLFQHKSQSSGIKNMKEMYFNISISPKGGTDGHSQ